MCGIHQYRYKPVLPFSIWIYNLYGVPVCYAEQGMIMAVNKPYSFFSSMLLTSYCQRKDSRSRPFPSLKLILFSMPFYVFFCNKVGLLPYLHLHQEPAKAGTSLYHHPFLVLVLRYLVFLVFFILDLFYHFNDWCFIILIGKYDFPLFFRLLISL